jgi:predicted permease
VQLVLGLDGRTLAMGTALTVAVTLAFGLVPAFRGSATAPGHALGDLRSQPSHRRLSDPLVAAQMAVCVFLLFGASLFAGTFERLQDRPLGFAPGDLLHLDVRSRTRQQHTAEDWGRLARELAAIPRVESAAAVSWAPLTGNRWRSQVEVAGRAPLETSPHWVSVWEHYFETMRQPLLSGRGFRDGDRAPSSDDAGRPVPGVAIVNETFARVYFDGRNPVGQRIVAKSSKAPMEIVGLTADAVYFSVREASQPTVYVPLEDRYGGTILVRTRGSAPDLLQVLRQEIPRLRSDLQVREATPFAAFVTAQTIRERLLAALSTFFAVLALVLAAIGLYGVLNYAVTRERREIGLRMALGARPGHIVTLLMTRLMGVVALGAAVGVAAGVAFGRVVQALLFETAAGDPLTLAVPLAALAAAAIVAVLPPVLRAARIDPAQTIRTEP